MKSLDEGRITFGDPPRIVRDPVCGMELDAKKPAAMSTHGGVAYYFCSMACRDKFDTKPEAYVPNAAGSPA